ncbi:hypothetical protein, partial [Streptosporangium jomthongense]
MMKSLQEGRSWRIMSLLGRIGEVEWARASVISFVGLPSDEQRQSFVNQLQMALFAWIRRNPAG